MATPNKPIVSVIMGSTSDLPVMKKACLLYTSDAADE